VRRQPLQQPLPQTPGSIEPLPQHLLNQVISFTIDPRQPQAAATRLATLGTTNRAFRAAARDQLDAHPDVGRFTADQRLRQAAVEAYREMARSRADVPYAAKLGIARFRLAAVIKDLPDVAVDLRHMAPPMSTETVAVLKEHPGLRSLDLTLPPDAHDMEAVLDLLARRPGVLRSLNLRGPPGGTRGPDPARLARALQAQTALETLDLSHLPLRLEGPLAEALAAQAQLHTLALAGPSLDAPQAQALIQALQRLPGLQHLDLAGRGLGEAGAAGLAGGPSRAPLRHLDLSRNQLGDAGVHALLAGAARPASLVLNDNGIGAAGGQALAASLERPPGSTAQESLRRLGLAGNGLGDAGVSALCHALQGHPALRELDLGRTQLGPEGMQHLAQALSHLPALRSLDLQGNNLRGNDVQGDDLGGPGFAPLAQALAHLPQLQHLNLNGTRLNAADLRALQPALQGLAGMKHLALGDNALGDGAAELGTALQAMTGLHTLDLRNIGLTPPRLQSLAGGLQHCTELRDLNLRFNHLGPDGAEALVPVLQRMPGLQKLDLGANDLGTAGIGALIPTLQAAQDLQVLRVLGNGIIEGALRLVLPRPRFHA
jgi:Ran GTPase-activating protein (RanGAP) involved in mRNA processing and transport